MNVGSLRRTLSWAVVLLAAGAAGCMCRPPTTTKLSPCPVQNKEHVVLLRAELQKDGNWKAIAHPDFITIRGYDPDKPDIVVIWPYRYTSTRIRFDKYTPPIPDPECNDKTGECRLKLPKGLTLLYKYKYTVMGTYDEKEKIDLVPNDPWIEVDR